MSQKDPTKSTTELVHSGTYAARLGSIEVASFFAAASLYTGSFGSAAMSGNATVNFGRPFSCRPVALRGFYCYKPGTVDKVKSLPSGAGISQGSSDLCSIYIVLTKGVMVVNNADPKTLLTKENLEDNPNVIAFGELPSGAATSGEGYQEFNIPLEYKEAQFDDKPTHIIVVCSASKYGDYMSGSTSSVLYVDDFSLVYDGEPALWK